MRQSIRDWKKPPGPLNVWKIVECEEKLPDGTPRFVRFSIQDIPENRFDEAITHLCNYFVADEVKAKSLGIRVFHLTNKRLKVKFLLTEEKGVYFSSPDHEFDLITQSYTLNCGIYFETLPSFYFIIFVA
ncbi:hypothetical protein QAD02_023304 [Eretmocerus hayati]|uniref:Uncharacterized protein n=1 Tax=Eretmocerus hayati TaxID=131215 RepID=A0ACC2Q0C8_9HYME|nr:hypothetical protein QAD02_023304 [Eretmocerus hayati]